MPIPKYLRMRSVTPKAERPLCGAKCRDGHPCQARAVWDYRGDEPRNGRCRLHGGLSTGPRKKRDGSPTRVLKALEWCRPEAAELQPCDYLYEVYCLVRLARLIDRL